MNQPEESDAVLDIRPEADFLSGHAAQAVNIPLVELPSRVHELPSPGQSILIARVGREDELATAVSFLEKRGHSIKWAPVHQFTATGPALTRLWRPSPFLVEALQVINSSPQGQKSIAPRKALDIACGTGRDAVYLAVHGYQVTAIDLLPDAVMRAEALAKRYGLSIQGVVRDLQATPSLPVNTFDLVIVFRYLQRSLFPAIAATLAPGGYLVYETFHEHNRQVHSRPSNPSHLLKSGELAGAFFNLMVMRVADRVERDGRFFSHLLARRGP